MSPETRQLQGMVEDAAWRYEAVRTEANRERLRQAWEDYNEAYRADVLREARAA